RHVLADLLQESLHVLRLGHQHEHIGPPRGLAVVQGGGDAVLARELPCALVAAARHDQLVRRPPARTDQAGEQRLAHVAAAEDGGPPAVRSIAHPEVLTRLETKNHTFAGRSARRRVRYGYHSVPYGM